MKVGQWGQRRKQEPVILSKVILKIKANKTKEKNPPNDYPSVLETVTLYTFCTQ